MKSVTRALFNTRTIQKNWSLVPLLSLMGFACVWAGANLVYAAITKTDVNFNKRRADRHLRWDPENIKFKVVQREKHVPVPERDQLLAEIYSHPRYRDC